MEIAVKKEVFRTWPKWGPKLAPSGHVGLKLGPKRSRWTPNWSHVTHMEVQVNSSMPQLGAATWRLWRELHTKLGTMETQHGEHCFKGSVIDSQKTWTLPVKMGVLRISDWAGYVPHMDLNLGRSCPQMGPSWGQVAPSWAEAEANWSKLGQCCGEAVPVWQFLHFL